MKILFISDIHGIAINLNVIENKIKEKEIDILVCLGDLYYAGPSYDNKYKINSKNVFEFLTEHQDKLICMMGNCDSSVDIKSSDFPICSGVSLINTDGLNIYITHGNEYSFEKNRKFNHKGILVYGHEHIPYIEKVDDMIYINVGSISLPRNENNPTYMIYENKTIVIYDINDNIIEIVNL